MEKEPLEKEASPKMAEDEASHASAEAGDRHESFNRSTPSDMEGNPRKIYVGNIPHGTDTDTLYRLFKKFGVIVQIDMKGRFAFMTFEETASADDAVNEMDKVLFKGEQINVQHHQSLKVRKGKAFNKLRVAIGADRAKKTAFRIVLHGLDYRVSWQDLKDFGRTVGEVNFANVFLHKGRKVGVVEYFDEKSFDRALKELDNRRLYEKRVRVEQDLGQLNTSFQQRRWYEPHDKSMGGSGKYGLENGDHRGAAVREMELDEEGEERETSKRKHGIHIRREPSPHFVEKDNYLPPIASRSSKLHHPHSSPPMHSEMAPQQPHSRPSHSGHKYTMQEPPPGSTRWHGHTERHAVMNRGLPSPSPMNDRYAPVMMNDIEAVPHASRSRERRRRLDKHGYSQVYKRQYPSHRVMIVEYPPEERHRERYAGGSGSRRAAVLEDQNVSPPPVHRYDRHSNGARYYEPSSGDVKHMVGGGEYNRYAYKERMRPEERHGVPLERYTNRSSDKYKLEGKGTTRDGAPGHSYREHSRLRSRSRDLRHAVRYEAYASR